MKLLLDTHAILWWLSDDASLSEKARGQIEKAQNSVFVSAASIWEIAIKEAAGKLRAPKDILEAIRASRFRLLDITAEHARRAGALPLHHQDPFDRMLIAQAMMDDLVLVSRDRRFSQYDVPLILA